MLQSPPLSTRSSKAAPSLALGVAATRAAREQSRARSQWVDVAKGLGIVLVVLGHALVGVIDAGLLPVDGLADTAHYVIYTFHMPLFFLLAGLFVQPRIERDAKGFLQGAFTRIAWPYLLWSTVQLVAIDLLSNLVNRGVSFDAHRFVALLWEPAGQFWFLQCLFVLQLAIWALLPRTGALVLLTACVALRVLPEFFQLPVVVLQVLRFAPFFALGLWAGPWLMRRIEAAAPRTLGFIALSGVAAWLLLALAVHESGAGYWSAAALPAAACGTVALLACAGLARGGFARAAAVLGRASMAIYVLHVMFVAGTRIVLHKVLGVSSPTVVLPLALAAGVAGPLLVRALAERWNLARRLGLQ